MFLFSVSTQGGAAHAPNHWLFPFATPLGRFWFNHFHLTLYRLCNVPMVWGRLCLFSPCSLSPTSLTVCFLSLVRIFRTPSHYSLMGFSPLLDSWSPTLNNQGKPPSKVVPILITRQSQVVHNFSLTYSGTPVRKPLHDLNRAGKVALIKRGGDSHCRQKQCAP